ncbi:MAG: SLC13 family permease [Opitutaceae bacterium]|nr:SLC13 family permease [Opitutaceae bacterium]
MNPPFAAVHASINLWPFAILGISVVFIILAITRLRMHAFIALILAAFLAGFLTRQFPAGAIDRLPAAMREDARSNTWVAAVELTALEFGGAAGTIAISIGLASIIGLCLMESGGADKVVRRFLAVFGEKRAALALLASTYILSIPIFFDTMFMLMVPLAKALRLRTGKDYLLYLMAICVAAILTHSLTVPHPGPLAMVDNLRVDPGQSLFWGVTAGIIPCLLGYFVAVWINRRGEVPLRETPGATLEELHGIAHQPESELPSFFWSITPVVLPIALIALASFLKILNGYPAAVEILGGAEAFAQLSRIASFIGNKNIALIIGAAIAMGVLARQRGLSLGQLEPLIEAPLGTAAVIILITSAGGAFGGMLRNAGVGDAIKSAAQSYNLNLIFLCWLTAIVLRIAQGSATVSMITTSAIIWPMIDRATNAVLPFHPMYVFLAIGFGAFGGSWMNDSGFWVVSKLGGLTEKETLKSWSVLLTVTSAIGLIVTLVASRLLPLV